MSEKCSVCNSQIMNREERIDVPDKISYVFVECPRCGKYKTTETSLVAIPGRVKSAENIKSEARYIISHWIRKTFNETRNYVMVDFSQIERIVKQENLPNIAEQSNNLILFLGRNIFPYSNFLSIPIEACEATIGALNSEDLLYIQKNLYDQGLLSIKNHQEEKLQITIASDKLGLTFEGWAKYEELRKEVAESKFVFMAMDYNDEELNSICEEHFKPAVDQTGFELILLRDKPKAGIIDNYLRTMIRRCKFLLADLTHGNNGAYWEAGYAEGLGKHVVYLCKKEIFDKRKTHFDTNHCTTIIWDKENIKDAVENLKATIRTTFPVEALMHDEN